MVVSIFMNNEEKLNSIMSEMKDLEIVRDLLNEVISLKQYKSRLTENQSEEFKNHVKEVSKYSELGNQSRIKYHLNCTKRILESAKNWEQL